jgi:Carboxypeptidase regulatory-like domain
MMRYLAALALLGGLLAPARAGTVVLTGVVIDQGGKPVADAGVWVFDYEAQTTPGTRTAAGGTFSLEVNAGKRRLWDVMAVAQGLALGTARLSLDEMKPIALRLGPETQVRGRVIDQDERPVAGAEVSYEWLRPANADPALFWDSVYLGRERRIRCETDADGRFALGHIPKGARTALRVDAAGFAHWQTSRVDDMPTGGQAEEVTIHLEREGVVEGRVTRDGRPAAGVAVRAGAVGPANGWGEGTTDAEGHYRLGMLAGGTYNVCLDELTEFVAAARESVKVRSGETVSGIDLAITPGGFIEGRMVDAETGKGVSGAPAAGYGPAAPRTGGGCMRTEADADGRYRLRVAAGRNYVYYQGGIEDYPYSNDASFEIDVAEGQTVQGPDIRVQRAKPVVVTVTNPDGIPAAGATVQAMTDFGYPLPADAAGKCEIRGLPPTRLVVLLARGADKAMCASVSVPAEKRGAPVAVTLAPAAAIEVVLVDPAGKPVAGASVSAWLELPQEAGPFIPSTTRLAQAKSDAEGLVRLEGLPAGSPVDVSTDETTANRVQWPDDIELTPGQTTRLGEVIVDLTRMAAAGTVIGPDGAPVRGAPVRISNSEQVVRTDAEGRFRFEGLVPSEAVTLLAASPDEKLWGAEEVVPEWQFEPGIVLRPLVNVMARVLDPAGKPMARAQVFVGTSFYAYEGEGLPVRREATTDEAGRVVVEGLVAGVRYDIRVRLGRVEGGWLEPVLKEFVAGPDVLLGDLTLPR